MEKIHLVNSNDRIYLVRITGIRGAFRIRKIRQRTSGVGWYIIIKGIHEIKDRFGRRVDTSYRSITQGSNSSPLLPPTGPMDPGQWPWDKRDRNKYARDKWTQDQRSRSWGGGRIPGKWTGMTDRQENRK